MENKQRSFTSEKLTEVLESMSAPPWRSFCFSPPHITLGRCADIPLWLLWMLLHSATG
jgi:hypothetical protein